MSGDSDTRDLDSYNLGALDDLVDGESRAFEGVGEYGIVVCNVQGEIYALEDNCSHADTPLSDGRLRGWHITCPLHGAVFDIRDGSHRGLPVCEGVRCYQVARVDGEVIVTLATGDAAGGMFETR